MNRNFTENSSRYRNGFERPAHLRVLPNEMHFALLHQMNTPEEWKKYSESYPHLAIDDYFWKKLIVRFPAIDCQNMNWVEAAQRVDFNFTLFHAVETNNVQLARHIFNYGGNVYQMDKENDLFLFFTAVESKKFDMARLFLDRGFNINTILKNNTVLMYVISKNDMESTKFLLETGANVNFNVLKRNALPFSALSMFCFNYFWFQNDDMLHLLIDYGADYNLKNRYNEVSLYFLIDGLCHYIDSEYGEDTNHIRRMFTLFIRKTDMAVVDTCNKTLLHLLCINYIYEENVLDLFKFIITSLLNAGVPVNAVDNAGKTALDYAVKYKLYPPFCEFLRQNGGLSGDELVIN